MDGKELVKYMSSVFGEPLVEVVNLKKYFPVKGILRTIGYVKAVDNVSFIVPKGKTLGLVGESG